MEENYCEMTYMYPNYIPVEPQTGASNISNHPRYKLYLYRDGTLQQHYKEKYTTDAINNNKAKFYGMPIVFIPGNGGSFMQVLYYKFIAL